MNTDRKRLPPIFFDEDFDEMHKVCWRVEQAVADERNPLLTPKYPWDSGSVAHSGGTVLIDPIDGKYKGWVTGWPSDVPERAGEEEYRLCYIESEDGIHWERPELDLWPWPGYPKTNILFDFPAGGRSIQASVMIDPESNPEEPYEMYCYREPFFECPAMVVEGMNQSHGDLDLESVQKQGPYYAPGGKYYGIYRHRSTDGIHWRPTEGPVFETGDSCSIFKNADGSYTAHSKVGIPSPPGASIRHDCYPGGCRTMFLRVSSDGSNWSERTLLIGADWRDALADQIMQADRTPYGDGFLNLTTIIHTLDQRVNVQWAASPDGVKYWRPIPRSPCMPNPPVGDYGGGMVWPLASPFEIDDRLYVYYGATPSLHGDIYSMAPHLHFPQNGALCRASWDMGRFFAVVNSRGGGLPHAYVTTRPSSVSGDSLLVNARTVGDGELLIELLDEQRSPIPGFTKEDCVPFRGDEKFGVVSWKGGRVPPRDTVQIRFYISAAMLYGFMWG